MMSHTDFRLAYFDLTLTYILKVNLAIGTMCRQIFWPSCFMLMIFNRFVCLGKMQRIHSRLLLSSECVSVRVCARLSVYVCVCFCVCVCVSV